jgi:dolichol kinase
MMIMLSAYDFDEPTNRTVFALAMQPLIWGDTFGEVIGSFFGKFEFNVVGIGEINKKTVEGTTSVFLSSYFSLWLTY